MNSLNEGKCLDRVKSGIKSKVVFLSSIPLLASSTAFAAVSQETQDAVTSAIADIVTVGGLILVAAATAFGLRWTKATFF